MTYCYSDFATDKEFIRALRADADRVFLKGRWQGREQHLTASTFIEVSPHLVVFGPLKSWRVHVEFVRGRGFVATRMRLHRERDITDDFLRLT